MAIIDSSIVKDGYSGSKGGRNRSLLKGGSSDGIRRSLMVRKSGARRGAGLLPSDLVKHISTSIDNGDMGGSIRPLPVATESDYSSLMDQSSEDDEHVLNVSNPNNTGEGGDSAMQTIDIEQ
ncbi:hypothetical protein V6N13_043504 [Hibiscus sabdariffa]